MFCKATQGVVDAMVGSEASIGVAAKMLEVYRDPAATDDEKKAARLTLCELIDPQIRSVQVSEEKFKRWANLRNCVPFVEDPSSVRNVQEAMTEMLALIRLFTRLKGAAGERDKPDPTT